MNRRSFFKFLGIGAATAALAPKMLAETMPKHYPPPHMPETITLEAVQKAYAKTLQPMPQGKYMYVRLAPTSLPVSAGDIVYYKVDKRWGTLAYKRNKLTLSQPMGYGIGTLTPGCYGFIQIKEEYSAVSYTVDDFKWEPLGNRRIQ